MEAREPTLEVISTLDDGLATFITSAYETGKLNNTALILLSDHGSQHGPYYILSKAGQAEYKLPLLTMLLPNQWLERNPTAKKNLYHNQQALITAYDIYKTLLFPLNVEDNTEPEFAYSIFDDYIPFKRTCKQARIPKELCICKRG